MPSILPNQQSLSTQLHQVYTSVIHARRYHSCITGQPAQQLVMESAPNPFNGVHDCILMSHGNDYVRVEVSSRGLNNPDPLLYIGEELTGFIVLSPGGLRAMQRIDLVLQVFKSNLMIPSGETRRVLLPHQVDSSHVSGGQLEYRWPFSIPPPAVTTSARSSSGGHSSLGHHSYDRNGDPEFKLVVAMHRPGLFVRHIELRQKIYYIAPPDPSIYPTSSSIPFDHSPFLPTDSSWSAQKFPSVMVKGVMFPERDIEVECKLLVPDSYPVSDIIPLRLVMTSEDRDALALVRTVPDAIDVRMFKVIGFGEKGKIIRPFSLENRSFYHRTDLVAEAIWELDGHPKELTSETHSRPRWHIKFNGNLRWKGTVKLGPSFEGKDMVIRYVVCLYPFRVPDFRPASRPNKPLFMGNIPLRKKALPVLLF